MMRVLVIGGGGREHALAWKIHQSELVSEIFVAPGNAGSCKLGTCVDLDTTNIVELADFAQEVDIDLSIVGPELPLSLGIVDEFAERDLTCFGPTRAAAEIESSKVYMKELCHRHGVPTAEFQVCATVEEADEALGSGRFGWPVVIKAEGLAAGKGVVIADDLEEARKTCHEILVQRRFGNAGDRLLVEQRLEGVELSYLVFTDGKDVAPLVSSQDYKRIHDHDEGPNTGGMGSISPSPFMNREVHMEVLEKIVHPVVGGMREEGRPYRGLLYAGLMLTTEGPKVLEFNCRFGDPETQAVLPRMQSDIVPWFFACVEGTISEQDPMEWRESACCCVVAASGGYPGDYDKGKKIEGLLEAGATDGVVIFHAGTATAEDGSVVTAGGRVLDVVSLAPSLSGAIDKAYQAMEKIRFEGMQYRTDIGRQAAANLELRRNDDRSEED